MGGSNATNTINTLGAADSNNGFFPDATSYWGNLCMSLGYAVAHNVPGAADGSLRMTGASNWSQFNTSAATQPVGALKITGGTAQQPGAPPWLAGMATNTFNTLSGTNYATWAATGIPAVSPFYRGTGPREAVVDAFCDPVIDPATGCIYLWGGGHGDGSYNGVIEFNPTTKAYRVVGQPTPPSVYLPGYMNTTAAIFWPSGIQFAGPGGFFYTVAQGLNPILDAGYIAPALAKVCTHAYQGLAIRGRKIHFFCAPSYAEFDIDAGTWDGWDVNMGEQLFAIQPNLTNLGFSQGNAAIYDDATDRFIVTLQPGDFPAGNRNGIFVFNPSTRLIESVLNQSAIYLGPSPSMVKAGRKVYLFYKVGNYLAPQDMNRGLIYNIDAKTFSYFTIQGDPAGTIFSAQVLQECIPAWFDGTSIHRWNYEQTNALQVHTVNLTPVSGSGTSNADPYILTQTSRSVAAPPAGVQYRYRGNYWPAANAMLILPQSNQDWRVLLLS